MIRVILDTPIVHSAFKVEGDIFPLRDHIEILDSDGKQVPILEIEKTESGYITAFIPQEYVGQVLTIRQKPISAFYKRDVDVRDADLYNSLIESSDLLRKQFEEKYNYSLFAPGEIRIYESPAFFWERFTFFENMDEERREGLIDVLKLITFELSKGYFPLEEGFDVPLSRNIVFIVHRSEIITENFNFTENPTNKIKIIVNKLIYDIFYWDKVPNGLRVGYTK